VATRTLAEAETRPDPWEKQPGESPKAFRAFAIYRDTPTAERSQRRVAAELGKSGALIGRWSSQHSWVARAEAWDSELDRVKREAAKRGIEEMNDRHIGIALQMQAIIVKRLQEANIAIKPEQLDPSELARWFDLAYKAERMARGVADTSDREIVFEQRLSIPDDPDTIAAALDFLKLAAQRSGSGDSSGENESGGARVVGIERALEAGGSS
jgi:hypothetical protein